MAGILDSLFSGSQGGYGGLLNALLYPSPLQKPEDVQQPQYDPMGNYTGITPQPSNPFGPPPAFNPQQFAPASPFNQGATPIAGLAQSPQAQAPALPPAQSVAPAPQVAAPQNMPDRTMKIGGYQMPQFGEASAYQPLATDFSAQQRQAPQPEPQQKLPPAFGGGGYIDRINNGGSLIGSLFGNDSPAQQNLKAQYQSLVPMLGPQKAMLAVMNPEAGKVLLNEALTNKQEWGVVSDNPIEGKKYGFINKYDQTINDKPVGAAGGSGESGIGMLAPGVKFDSSKSGDDYLNQFSPEVKAAALNYIKGDTMPSGNPRQNGIANIAKTIAQKYGADIGVPVSDALYAEKRKYRTELGTNSPNSAGGQAKAFNQGISHMTALAGTLEKLDNSNGMGIPMIAQGVNAMRQGASNSQSAIADEAKSIGQTVAGEVGKLFSGSAGGGVHERELTRERFDTIKSKPQLAAALRATLETMQGGLQALEQRRDSVLGPNSGVELVNESTKANIAKIQGTIDRLEGRSSASGGIPAGWSVKVR